MSSIKFGIVIGIIIAFLLICSIDKDAMITKVYESGLLTSHVEIAEDEFQREFMSFIADYGKSYQDSVEFYRRYTIFKQNYQHIMNHNVDADEHGFELGVNKFADISNEEFRSTHLGLNPPHRPSTSKYLKSRYMKKEKTFNDLPDKVDWREEGVVNEPKDQGYCGSCWAFSTIASVEGAVAIKTGKLYSLSEEQLVSCSKGYGNGGCSGGYMEYAFKYAEKYPLCTEDEYPYNGTDSYACEHSKCSKGIKLKGFADLEEQSREALYTGITQQPVSIGVCAGNIAWQFYKKGVMKRFCGQCLDHGVVTVGYGNDAGDYIIVRNSWGKDWGEQGYLRISSKDTEGKGTCGIYQLPSVPFFE